MIKTEFGIKDLENLSNVKAHTIRIWEKRYNLLQPDRTDTNIRKYNLDNLKKLLNIAYLYNAGYKISKLASLDAQEIQSLIQSNVNGVDSQYAVNIFKSAMFEFDAELFETTLEKLLKEKSFREVFTQIFTPLLNEMGILWHSGTIDPSHEHFISEKIKHTIIQHTYKAKPHSQKGSNLQFVLYLPYNEIHEIGLLYANYELQSAGFNTLYLGPNLAMESLNYVTKTKTKVIFVAYFTIKPDEDNFNDYLQNFEKEITLNDANELWVLGRKADKVSVNNKYIKCFKESNEFIAEIDSLEKSL